MIRLQKILSKGHLLAGIEYYQEEYPEHEVMFLAVSDDMDWVARHLAGVRGVVLAGSLLDYQHDEQHDSWGHPAYIGLKDANVQSDESHVT